LSWNLVIGDLLKLCTVADIKDNLVPDSFLTALAIESGSEWITTDRDYHRFPGLRVRHSLQQPERPREACR
jgi:predicted nucleic acid-binding protein